MFVCNSKTKHTHKAIKRERYRDGIDTNPNPNLRALLKIFVTLMEGEEAPSYRQSLLQRFPNKLVKREIPPYSVWRGAKCMPASTAGIKISEKVDE